MSDNGQVPEVTVGRPPILPCPTVVATNYVRLQTGELLVHVTLMTSGGELHGWLDPDQARKVATMLTAAAAGIELSG